jgi:hypothetical protein
MNWGRTATIGFLVAAAAGGYYVWTNTYSAEGAFQTACEDSMKKRLRSPSTYRRIEFKVSKKILSLESYHKIASERISVSSPDSTRFDVQRIKRIESAMKAGTEQPYLLSGFIEYDAANAYGTPIRSTVLCEWFAHSKNDEMWDIEVRIDGKTYFDYLEQSIKNSKSG